MEMTEEQINAIKEKISQMSPEELENLKKEAAKQCPFCLMNQGKIPVKKVYEDGSLMGILDINPANKGHIILFPKMHYENSFEMDEIAINHIWNVANSIGKKLIEVVNAEGINFFVANGEAAGQRVGHFLIHIIPRFKDDNINFAWAPKEVSEEDMNLIVNSFQGFYVESPKKEEKVEEVVEEEPQEEIEYEYDDERIP